MQSFETGIPDDAPDEISVPDAATDKRPIVARTKASDSVRPVAGFFAGWIDAFKHVWVIYLATHLAFLVLTYLASLLILDPYAHPPLLHTLLQFWDRWDTNHFVGIATSGYTQVADTAFFPLYPLLIRLVSFVVGSPLVAALIVANVAGLGVLLIFYRLVAEEFGTELAERSVLYLAIFPTAFFLVAAYSESLFLLCALGAFYCIRRGRWWMAGLAMFFAALTRSTGVVLIVPFCYEYLRQRNFQWWKIRPNVLSCASVGLALVLYSLYCYARFHDFLAFSHAEAITWGRHLTWPGEPLLRSIFVIMTTNALSFVNTRNLVELTIVLAVLVLLILAFVGPWKFARKDRVYPLYGVMVFLLCISLPVTLPTDAPLDSLDRYMLAIFPVAIVLAAMGKNKHFHLLYQALGYSLMAFYLLLFLTHRLFV